MAAAINIRRSSHNVTAKQIDEAVGAGNSGGGGGEMRDENGLKKEKATGQGGKGEGQERHGLRWWKRGRCVRE